MYSKHNVLADRRGGMARSSFVLRLFSAFVSLLAATVLAGCGIFSSVSLPKLVAATNDKVVFYIGTGSGSETIDLNRAFLGPKNPTYLPGGILSIQAVCVGSGMLIVEVSPGKESLLPSCYSTGGEAAILDGPANLPWPKKILIKASKGTKWSVAVVDPQGSFGVGEEVPG